MEMVGSFKMANAVGGGADDSPSKKNLSSIDGPPPMLKDEKQQQLLSYEHLSWNKSIVMLTIFNLSLEIPLQRFVFRRQSTSTLVANIRIFMFTWVLIKLILAIILNDCQYSETRALLWDWTIYYPMARRINLLRCFVSMCIYHLCAKCSVYIRRKKPLEASLVDFLTQLPPPSPVGGDIKNEISMMANRKSETTSENQQQQKQLEVTQQSNYLRDRRHWFELSWQLRKSFKLTLWCVLPICWFVILGTTIRLGFSLKSERKCDIERPFLRWLGVLEINYCLVECMLTYVGSFTYSLMVKHDILLQANRVEHHLAKVMENCAKQRGERKDLQRERLTHTSERHFYQRQQLPNYWGCRGDFNNSAKRAQADHCAMMVPPLPLLSLSHLVDQHHHLVAMPKHELVSRKLDKYLEHFEMATLQQHFTASSDFHDSSDHENDIYMTHLSMIDEHKPLSQVTTGGHGNLLASTIVCNNNSEIINRAPLTAHLEAQIREAQMKVTLFLRCIDSHKPAISHVGSSIFIWMILSLSWAPVLFIGWRSRSGSGNLVYAAASSIAISNSLVFTFIGAAVHERAIELTRVIFRLCAQQHSKSIAHHWNKLFLIWFSPNRCALKIVGFFQLTYLNILKSMSFMISGLTLVINYTSD